MANIKKRKLERKVALTPMDFARACDGAIAETCIKGLDKGMSARDMCLYELRLWAAASVIGCRLFGFENVDFSDGRIERLKSELEEGKWTPKEVEA